LSEVFDALRDALADRYTLQRELGRGGMATVYLADDLKHGRQVAIKVLHAEIAAAIGPERFVREIEIAARLQHPHILPLYDSGSAGSYLFYVMPFVEGESLRDRLDREKQLPQEDVIKITSEVASALGYAHSRDIVHRDIKPENIMLSGGTAVVADFGIARAASAAEQQQLTQTGTVIGTPAYMSPEQGTGDPNLDGRSDQYSLACVVYEMLVGMPPFTGPNVQAIIARHSMDFVSPPSIIRETIPETMEAALLRALAKVPADRFPTVIMFAEALAAPSTVTAAMRRKTGMTAMPRAQNGGWRRALRWGVPAVLVLTAAAWGARRLIAPRPPTVEAIGGLEPRNIAVEYFDDLSPDSSLGYLADGLTEALIEELGGVQGLRVISKGGVALYRGSTLRQDSIARALDVGTLIVGSVEPRGDNVRVSIRMLDGATGADYDRKSFDAGRGDPLSIKDSLARQVADLVRERLGQEVRLQELRAGTSVPGAWLLAEQAERTRKDGDALLRTNEEAGLAKYAVADSLLAAATAADPKWVEPVLQRGWIAFQRSRLSFEFAVDSPWINTGLVYAERALGLAPNYAPALELRGSLRYWTWVIHGAPDPRKAETLLRDAEADLREAVRRDPSLPAAWSTLSHLDYQKGDVAQAKLDATSAYNADAYYSAADVVLWRLFTSSYDLEAFADAEHWCAEGQRRFPDDWHFTQCQLWMLTTKAKPADVTRAWQLVHDLEALVPKEDWPFRKLDAQIAVAAVLARAGSVDSAQHLLDRSQGNLDVDPAQDLLYSEAFVRTLLGEKDKALRLLQRYVAGHAERRADLAKDYQWWFRDLRSDPRYQQLAGTTH
jgi:eukaryotic-like serine/threonine-protein kinase